MVKQFVTKVLRLGNLSAIWGIPDMCVQGGWGVWVGAFSLPKNPDSGNMYMLTQIFILPGVVIEYRVRR